MTEFDEPPWKLLPDDPQGFFGLNGQFDLKDLKRRYTQLIKKYKPEKSPAEFQKIRAAYESIELRLRYQMPAERTIQFFDTNLDASVSPTVSNSTPLESQSSAWSTDSDRFERQHPMMPVQPAVTLLERVQRASPDDLRIELRSKSELTEDERILLAFLEDACLPDGETQFFDNLLIASRKYQDESAWNVLFEFLRTDEARARCEDYLPRLFAELDNSNAFAFSEPLWLELQSRLPFDEFLKVLDVCLGHVQNFNQFSFVMFHLRLVKQTLFYAPTAWIAEQMKRVQSSAIDCPDWFDAQVWHLERLIKYRMIQRKFLNGNPLRSKIDEVIQLYCVASPEFERRLSNLQVEILGDFQTIDRAFPKGDKTIAIAWDAWQYVCDQASRDLDNSDVPTLEESQLALEQLRPQLTKVCRPLFSAPWRWDFRTASTICGIYLMPFGILFFIVCIVNGFDNHFWEMLGIFGICGLMMSFIYHMQLEYFGASPVSWLANTIYRWGMRRVLVAFVKLFPITVPALYARLRTFDFVSNHVNNVRAESEHDYALRFYTAAAWHLR